MIYKILQYAAIGCFAGLATLDFSASRLNFGGLNLSLTLLYIFLYLTPFSK